MSTWIGTRKLAIIPAVVTQQISSDPPVPPAPPNFYASVIARAAYDLDIATNRDRSLRKYIHSISYGRALLDVQVFDPVTVAWEMWGQPRQPNPGLTMQKAIAATPAAKSIPYKLVVFHQGFGVRSWAFWSSGSGTAYVSLSDALGAWAMEVTHMITEFGDLYGPPLNRQPSPGRFDYMDCSCGTHPSVFTKLALGWVDAADVPIVSLTNQSDWSLHGLAALQPPPPGRVVGLKVPSISPKRYLLIEARLPLDDYERGQPSLSNGLPSTGVVINDVDETLSPPLWLRTPTALKAGQTLTVPEFHVTISVPSDISGGMRVLIKPESPAWHDSDLSALTGAPAATGELTAYVTDFPDSGYARVVYLAQDGHICELYLSKATGVWSSADLTAIAGGAPATYYSELAAYVTDFPDSGYARVVYCAENGHICELYLSKATGVWSSADLTAIAGGAPARFNGELAAYVTDFPDSGYARVVYRAQDGHIWELYLSKATGVWSSADLTAIAGGAPAANGPTAYVTDFPDSGYARVVYRAEDSHIWELYLSKATGVWSSADLTAIAGGAPAANGPTAYVTDFPDNGYARVVYRAEDGHIWELYLSKATGVWSSADLTAIAGGAPAGVSELAAYVTKFPDSGYARVVYYAENDHIWELYLSKATGVWSSADLTAIAGGAPVGTVELAAYVTKFPNGGGARVICAEDGDIWELYLAEG